MDGWIFRFSEYTTSAAVSGCPSENFTPGRMRNVYTSRSAEMP